MAPPMTAYPTTQAGIAGIEIAGYIFAVLMPLVGFILGIISAVKPKPQGTNHGVFIIIVSVVAFLFWMMILSAGGSSGTTSYSY